MKILIIDKGMPFTFDSYLNEPLGGSELSINLLTKGLGELGQSVVLLNSSIKDVPQQRDNVLLHNVNSLKSILPESEVVILNRCLPEEPFHTNLPIYYYSHDAYDQDHILYWLVNKKVLDRVTKILCVSEWQRQTFNKYYDVPLDKMIVIGNLIPIDEFYGYTERNENKLIFASIPYKGLEILPQLFNDICLKSKQPLELDIYSSMNLYGDSQGDIKYEKTFSDLSKMKGVTLFNAVGFKELAYAFNTSSMMIHPQLYHETFGNNYILSQAAGCIPVTVNSGAVNEVILNDKTGFITKGKSILNHNTYIEFIDLVLNFLESDKDTKYSMRRNGRLFSRNWNYINVAKNLLFQLENDEMDQLVNEL